MSFTGNFSCNTLRSGLANASINLTTDTFYLALYTNDATLDETTTESPAWTGAITSRGALIYKAGANGAICVLDFGNDKTSTSTFTVTMPANTSTSALIRIV